MRSMTCLLGLVGLVGGCAAEPADEVCAPDPAAFATDIWPTYIASSNLATNCVGRGGCHDADNSPGSRLQFSLVAPIDHDANYQALLAFVDCDDPSASPALTKPLAGVGPHVGGDLFASTDDPAVAMFLAWLEP